MSPLQFEAQHAHTWQALEDAMSRPQRQRFVVEGSAASAASANGGTDAAEFARLYRRCSEHLALARSRGYPLQLVERLDDLAHRAHQRIYRHHSLASWRAGHTLLLAFPRAVRAHARLVLLSTLVFLLPGLVLGLWCYLDPGAILMLMPAENVREFEGMYGPSGRAGSLPMRDAESDWTMFGVYVFNNIRIAFQCFASGLFAGVGSLFYLAFNGAYIGGVAGFLTVRGHGPAFWSFVATHSAFELTAIVLSGAAGLGLGGAVLMPGRSSRSEALREAGARLLPIIYGVIAMLLIAAAIEAFWSSAAWVAPAAKGVAAALCWAVVLAGLLLPGRPGKRD